jgi:quinoprotein glucose dehydrogenase
VKDLRPRSEWSRMGVLFVGCLLLAPFTFASAADDAGWSSYGADPQSTKYSPLAQIDAGNFADLEVTWIWDSPDNAMVRDNRRLTPIGYKSTPVIADGVLYVSTSLGQVAAIDAVTGTELWRFDTGSWRAGRPTNLGFNHRGVALWQGAEGTERVLMPTNDGRLWSLDAGTGKPDPQFGENGVVDLAQGLGREIERKHYSVISAPTIVGNTVIVGSSIMDGPRTKEMPPGHVRGFDIASGEQRWMFHTIPQKGEAGVETWEDGAWIHTGNTNVWTLMSADPESGYVYLPTGTPTNDWYGGHRKGDNLYAESLVCVDAATGERIWHFQMVHHGLWDYDLPAAPNLVDIVVDGKAIKAVAQVSKQGYLYVFDRLTGEPVWPIEERPVPQSQVPGEQTSATQPRPTRPAPFEQQGISSETLIDYTPELREAALKIVAEYDHGPLYTPPSLRGTINLPGWAGGANWSGAAVDPSSGIIYIPSVSSPMVVKLRPGEKTEFDYVRGRGVNALEGPAGLPLVKPPYSRVTAIDLNTGEHLWMQPFGDGLRQKVIAAGIADPGAVGGPRPGGPLLTSTLLMIGEGGRSKRPVLRAFDKLNGSVVGEVPLPGPPTGTPMTYQQDGRQFIVLAAGYADQARLIALALPKERN